MDPTQLSANAIKTILTGIGVFAAVMTLREGNRLQYLGAKIYPLGWAIAAFFTLGLSTPVFLLMRRSWLAQVESRKERQRVR